MAHPIFQNFVSLLFFVQVFKIGGFFIFGRLNAFLGFCFVLCFSSYGEPFEFSEILEYIHTKLRDLVFFSVFSNDLNFNHSLLGQKVKVLSHDAKIEVCIVH